MALHVDLAPGESVEIGSGTTVRVERKSGGRVRLAIDSDYRVKVIRSDDAARPARPTSKTGDAGIEEIRNGLGGPSRPRPDVD